MRIALSTFVINTYKLLDATVANRCNNKDPFELMVVYAP